MIPFKLIQLINGVLKSNLDSFLNIKTKEDELNIDTHLKNKVVQIISKNINIINNSDSNIKLIKLETNTHYFNRKNINESISKYADLVITYSIDNTVFIDEIELKKTQSNKIPGSSIKQIQPFKSVIFFKLSKNNIDVESGYYCQVVSGTIRFPDRLPRPEVSFSNIKQSNKELENIDNITEDVFSINTEIFTNDIDTILSNKWFDNMFNGFNQKEKTNNWHKEALKKFLFKTITKYKTMTKEEQDDFLNYLKED